MSLLGDGNVQELLGKMLQVGEVASVGTDGRARCTFADRDGVTSNPLQVVHRRRGDQDMPEVGSSALCLLLPPDFSDGFVLGVVYDAGHAPPVSGSAAPRVTAGDDVRLGSHAAAHKIPLGDVLLRVANGLREMAATVQVICPTGAGKLMATTTDYGAGPFDVVAGQMAADVTDAALLSQRVRVRE